MSLSQTQLQAISVTERICSAVSLLGTSIIVVSFLSSRYFRKPINRLVFYACFGNIMANVATLISQDGIHAGANSNVCQFQAFLIQWFMPADALWTFAMAFNVHLTFFRKYNSEQLRRLEWKYVLLCYGLPFLPAFVYFFIKTRSRGKIYGSAVLWCWVAPSWDFMRIAAFYGPAWFVIFMTLSIYIRIGLLVWRRRRQLREAGGFDTTIDLGSSLDSPGFSKVTEISITREPAFPPAVLRHSNDEISGDIQPDYCSPQSLYHPYSVSVEGGDISPTDVPLESMRSDHAESSTLREAERGPEPESGLEPEAAYPQRHGSAAWAYTKYAMLFFVALLVTWLPSTINRVHAFAHPDDLSFGLNYASSFVLPLQGFWNSLIYVSLSWPAFKLAYADFREGKFCRANTKIAYHHSAGHGGFITRRTSSGHDSARRLTI